MCIIWFVFYKGADIELSAVLNMYVKLAVHYPMYNLTANTVTSVIFSRWFMISIQGLILYTDFFIVPGIKRYLSFPLSASSSCFTNATKISKNRVSYSRIEVHVIHSCNEYKKLKLTRNFQTCGCSRLWFHLSVLFTSNTLALLVRNKELRTCGTASAFAFGVRIVFFVSF